MTEVSHAGRPEHADTATEVVARWLPVVAHRLGPGELAELRRLDPAHPSAPVFWKFVASMADVDTDPLRRRERERRFAVILRTFAQLRDVQRGGRRLGSALAEAGLDPRRLLQLLRARKGALAHAVRTTCHFLASKAATVDAMGLARLVLSEDTAGNWEEDERRRVARDYFREVARPDRHGQGDER